MILKTVISTAAAALSLSLLASPAMDVSGEVQASRQARSVHLWWQGLPDDAVEASGSVTILQEQTNSYYMAIGFDGGYMGLQNVQGLHVGIFSIWDPLSNAMDFSAKSEAVKDEHRARVVYAAEGINVSRFGGEGTGAKTMFGCNWKVGQKLRFRVTAEPEEGDRTLFTGYIGDASHEEKIAAISRPNHGRDARIKMIHSFVEDFWRNGHSKTIARKAEFSGFAAKRPNGESVAATGARFTGDRNTLMSVDCIPVSGGAILQTGGDTENTHVPVNTSFSLETAD